MLVSDNGSRLFIDGEERIDNWAPRRPTVTPRSRIGVAGATVPLEAGVHHLRVEYFEDRDAAQLHLTASFDEETPPAPIPAERLIFPGLEFDESDPCGG